MTGYRTNKQIEADKLDCEMFRLVSALERFSEDFKAPTVKSAAIKLNGIRSAVRQHMHSEDRKGTA